MMENVNHKIAIKAYMPVVDIEWACTEAVKEHIRQEIWHHINDQIPFGAYDAIYSRFIQY